MITCKHKDCGYQCGWTHRGGEDNKLIEPPEGDFYEVKAFITEVNASRFHGDNNEMKLLGCPKCHRLFMSPTEESYQGDSK